MRRQGPFVAVVCLLALLGAARPAHAKVDICNGAGKPIYFATVTYVPGKFTVYDHGDRSDGSSTVTSFGSSAPSYWVVDGWNELADGACEKVAKKIHKDHWW